ncbi:PQQ-like beta-propeller repeat protein [Sphingomonas jatrophae]|nr:PQQ-like beta-propeller repeat protein [Sphingomonas jatrophae]
MKRVGVALATLALLSSCGIFRGDGKKSKTPVLGERVPVLTAEAGAEVDATIAELPVVVPAAAPNAAWAQPGGNAEKSMGHVALGATLARAWTAKIDGGGPKARLGAAPVIADGKLFVVDTQAQLHAFDAKTGARLWQSAVGSVSEDSKRAKGDSRALYGGGVSYDDGKVYATNGLGDAVAFTAADGKQLWKVRPGGPLRGAPTVSDGNVYVVSADNQLFALSATDGSTVWNAAGTLEVAGVFGVAAPASGAQTVVAGFSSGELTAYRYENGRAVWQDALSRTSISTAVASLSDIDASPVIDQGRVYAVGQGGRMVAMELVTGQRVWELNIAGISTPWVAGDWLFVVTDDARLLCIQRTTGRVRWSAQLRHFRNQKKKTGPITWIGPVLAGDRLLVASSRGELVSVGVADGKVGDAVDVGDSVALPLVVADNMLYVLTNDGQITAWR